MERNDIFDRLLRLETSVNQLAQEATELKSLVVEMVETNVALQLENDNLKKVLGNEEVQNDEHHSQDIAAQQQTKKVKKPLPSKDNLAILYGEGFHICKGELFGKHRHGEDCLFCLNVLSD
ncbi:DNA replication initiation control protein YabA [Staphylococcus simiae]|uniref:DNA replication initiation control protein YabA n=1 Tax=Staphylococcus simiae TaxID=308354 RepID=UPI001A9567A2|nr:DNA replication initiation control protein YabA [Staphylococcus simiae]MBO1199905.1 DNA replication initiation control protein YabA [Staphylococcus simiae]MBO1202179.1 DNA replication initiation control protein YabA [Staphylococcus simiae]MBO1204437.1 DNA replication initiation control protein YabA [Staphylococcus simiae]MBO1211977.1 DNA replication initiation control protein YabA [Staphylococcus simiae]MBO1230622.1 DNA replication initiation control protein YabA [Staphylococcus simiae]